MSLWLSDMRAAINIALALLLLVMQAVALVAPHSVEDPNACHCCACGSDACAPSRAPAPPLASPLASPLAALVQESRAEAGRPSLRPVPQTAFPVPVMARQQAVPSRASLSPVGSPRPLYERFCLLLI